MCRALEKALKGILIFAKRTTISRPQEKRAWGLLPSGLSPVHSKCKSLSVLTVFLSVLHYAKS